MKQVRIAGVPEHFNLPWHMAIEEGAFEERGINLEWVDVPEGTGKMSAMLEQQQTDLAVILTEGIIKSISGGNPSKIVQTYVESPLLWGIHVAASSPYHKESELLGKKAAISRPGSGSQLMAYLHAAEMGWDTNGLEFEIVNNIEGAVQALTEARADYFLWEHFTTKPLVDGGVFRRVGDFPTPWPCFVVAANNDFLDKNSGLMGHILEVINRYTSEFKDIPSIDRTLAHSYGQQLDDIRKWLSHTRWSQRQLETESVVSVMESLLELGLIDKKIPAEEFLA